LQENKVKYRNIVTIRGVANETDKTDKTLVKNLVPKTHVFGTLSKSVKALDFGYFLVSKLFPIITYQNVFTQPFQVLIYG